ncbi:MAG TPA: fructosamine kinase family protein [Methyloceanibacter sp.]|jgi:fructosamine-3-kinase|nr:fructosamine kinase family protein [Methyloceanibacter sp.]
MTPALKQRLEAVLGARVVETDSLPVGFGLTGLELRLEDGRHLAVKAAAEAGGGRGPDLALEAYMLGELARLSQLPVPQVHYADASLLVMDYIEHDGGGITPSVERHAGELIAALHATPRDTFGYERDTLIGPLHQPNPESDRWVPFFRDQRLMFMARAAHEEGALPAAMLARIELLAARIGDYLSEPPFPSLLHGDLWTGNVLVRDGRVAGLVDPAIYRGHPEIELAFATLFGTFGSDFFDAYASTLPLAPGFHEERRDIYNLYPRLVHVRLFGSGYLAGIDATLRRCAL